MEPTTMLSLATGSVRLLRAAGIIKTSADRIAAETRDDVRALMRKDFNAAMSALEEAAHTDSDRQRERSLAMAADHFRLAEAQDRLPRHLKGLAAGVLAAFARRDEDEGAARLWASKAVTHYDAALRGLDRAAQKSVGMLKGKARWDGGVAGASIALLGALGPAVAVAATPVARRQLAQRASRKVPSRTWVAEVGAQAVAAHTLGRELRLDTDGRATGLLLERHGGVITRSKLLLAPAGLEVS